MSAERVLVGNHRKRPGDYEPFDAVRVGDVIRWNGRLRTVRTVTRTDDDKVVSFGFAKLHRSGYPSPLTIYWRNEARRAFGGIVARRKGPLCAVDAECRLTRWIEDGERTDARIVTERETVGVLW